MAVIYRIQKSTLDAIGNAIREKTGGTDLIDPVDMSAAIEGIAVSDNNVLRGSFTLAENYTNGYTLSIESDVAPDIFVFWAVNPAFKDKDGNALRYRGGGIFVRNDAGTQTTQCIGFNIVNAGLSAGVGGSQIYGIDVEKNQVRISSNATYPLLAGVEYQWLATYYRETNY